MVSKAVLVVAGFLVIGCAEERDAGNAGQKVKEPRVASTGTSAEEPQAGIQEKKEVVPDIPLGTSFANLTNVTGGVQEPNPDKAVRSALDWLMRHQNEDGSWSCRDWASRCDKVGGPCRNHPDNVDVAGSEGRGWRGHDIGVTALAMLERSRQVSPAK